MGKLTVPKRISERGSQHGENNNPSLGNEVTEKTYIDHAEEEITVSQPVHG